MPTRLPTRLKTTRLPAILVALALGLAAPLAQADNLADIQKLMKAGQYPQALEKTDAYIAGKPRDAQGRFMKGLILTEMNRPADAIAVFTKLTEDYPELPEPYNNLAVLYAQQKQYDKARTALEMAIRTHPAYAIAYENLGDVYAKLASQAYDKALQLDSNNAAAQGKLSLIRDLVSTNVRPGSKPAAAAKPAEPVKVAAAEPAKPAAEPPKPAAATVVPVSPAAVTPARPMEAPKAADKPAEKPAAPAKPANDAAAGEADAAAAVQSWAAAWSKKDVKAYLAHYAPDFQTPNGMPRKAWEAERQQRIDKPGKIQVSVDDLKVSVDGNKATVKFRQNYKSATLSSSAGKTLVLIRAGSKWLIQQERVG
ncbi:tetratricopeptide repeat protein [Azospira restricta]|uniref:Tetratricopeptide repeat protein n=1 Tax=Azospira restricta TaxID=404405 RepID=A0A974SNL1_9RHOO|nr:tetratricopeptide repeat protein [Azospira restricta]QRJ63263.1 tetratricopeptide repeat protein [Azospira restricta]